MRSLVVYDSYYGNTQKIAETVADEIEGRLVKVQDFRKEILQDVTLLIVGCPIHGWRPSKPIADFLASLPRESLKGVEVAAFDTRIKGFFSGSASDKVNKKLVELGGKSVAPPGKFIVKGKTGPLAEGELENAKLWAGDIMGYLDMEDV